MDNTALFVSWYLTIALPVANLAHFLYINVQDGLKSTQVSLEECTESVIVSSDSKTLMGFELSINHALWMDQYSNGCEVQTNGGMIVSLLRERKIGPVDEHPKIHRLAYLIQGVRETVVRNVLFLSMPNSQPFPDRRKDDTISEIANFVGAHGASIPPSPVGEHGFTVRSMRALEVRG